MDSTKYTNIFEYVKSQKYPAAFSKNEKLILRKFCKNFAYDDQTDCLFYIDKRRDGLTLKRLVITEMEKSRVFEECHSADFFWPYRQRQCHPKDQAALLLARLLQGFS